MIVAVAVLLYNSGYQNAKKKWKAEAEFWQSKATLAETERDAAITAHARAAQEWVDQVKAQEVERQRIIAEQEKAVKKIQSDNRRKMERLLKERENVKKQVEEHIRQDAVVTAPREFRVLYDRPAALTSPDDPASQGRIEATLYPLGASTKTETFAAPSFTEVVVGNMYECADVFNRYNQLIDIVHRWKEIINEGGVSR